MRYLVVCNHAKLTVTADTPDQAMNMCPCKKCRAFDLKTSRWHYHDIRVYREDGTIDAKTLPLKHTKKDALPQQLDWVG